ncbi:MAG: hypothetical protein K5841_00235 [Fretibacterium sp.]|nr:hypothetical protein [Fretibacterium sp.]
MMAYDVRFFRPEEFQCRCCGQGQPAQSLVLWLDLFRAAWGGPVRINSGFRCPAHNAEAGGAKQSRHLPGCAADIAPLPGDMARRMLGLHDREVIEYPWGMHVAVPGDESARKWNGSPVPL